MTRTQWEVIVQTHALSFAARALLPKLAHRLAWPTRLGPRGLVVYIAFNTLFLFSLRQFLLPKLKRMAATREQAAEDLRKRLGREPTDEELFEHLGDVLSADAGRRERLPECPELDSNQRPTP